MASDSGDRLATLKRCLSVLRDARNDSEQFAALLLVRTRGIASGEGKGEAGHPAGHGSAREMRGGGDWELRAKLFQSFELPFSKAVEPGLDLGMWNRCCHTLETPW